MKCNFAYDIEDIVLSKETIFVRIHRPDNQNRPWMIAIEDFKRFTSQEDMIKALALPMIDDQGNLIKPTELSLVKVPSGTKIRKSVVRPQDWPGQGHLPGGAIQYEIKDIDLRTKEDWFRFAGFLDDFIH